MRKIMYFQMLSPINKLVSVHRATQLCKEQAPADNNITMWEYSIYYNVKCCLYDNFP